MGGEKKYPAQKTQKSSGSPPRGRGKAGCAGLGRLWPGITPAWAGKRGWMRATEITRKDHPRVGGEKGSVPAIAHNPAGSPPRGRGKGFLARLPPFFTGITPAWAGKRCVLHLAHDLAWDHPRVGGEKDSLPRLPDSRKGSPPRGRGKAKRSLRLLLPAGITPAWAGKSHPSGSSMACW